MVSKTSDSDVALLGMQIEYLNILISYRNATYELQEELADLKVPALAGIECDGVDHVDDWYSGSVSWKCAGGVIKCVISGGRTNGGVEYEARLILDDIDDPSVITIDIDRIISRCSKRICIR
jgi:hypothetical protein